ncbi:MAG: hypothetical protein RJA34_1193, partial [Pseudomonadota bacterium]
MSMPSAVRHINEVRLLAALYRLGMSTRADLGRELGLMRSTVGNLIAGLIEQGMVFETEVSGYTPGGRTGRPGQSVQLNPHHSAIIGADIGIDHLSVVAVGLTGIPVVSKTVDFDGPSSDVEQAVSALAALIARVMRSLPSAQPVSGICIVAPGLVDHDKGTIMRAPVLGWHDVPIQALLKEKLKWAGEISLENDANAFAAAEVYRRVKYPTDNALFVYMDAGVGGGLVTMGRLMRGHNGFAGEIGHIHLGEHGFETNTPVQGSFESYVGRNAVLSLNRHHGGSSETLQDFLDELSVQKPAALRTVAEWAWWMGRGIASLISVLNPATVVLGGPV